MLKNIFKQLKNKYNQVNQSKYLTKPLSSTSADKLKLDTLAAIGMFERKKEIENFTKLAISNPENCDYNELIKSNKIVDIFNEVNIKDMSNNYKLWNDLDID